MLGYKVEKKRGGGRAWATAVKNNDIKVFDEESSVISESSISYILKMSSNTWAMQPSYRTAFQVSMGSRAKCT